MTAHPPCDAESAQALIPREARGMVLWPEAGPFFLKLIVVHYHLRRGGVRRVIELALPMLARTLQPKIDEVWLVSGEPAETTWRDPLQTQLGEIPLREFCDPALGYFSEWNGTPAQHRAAVWQAVDRGLAAVTGPAIVWMQNASVGRNVTLARAFTARCAERGWPLLFHQHDWWFDHRWARWSELKRNGILRMDEAAAVVFPAGSNVHYLAINQADAELLQTHVGRAATWLPNPIGNSSPTPPERIHSARAWLQQRIGEAPAWILPCRLLRRKNVAEALLLTRLLRPEAWLVTTGGASSRAEQAYATRLGDAAKSAGWPLCLSVLASGAADTPSVEELIAASEAVMLTSLQEGFGLPFLEAALAERPLLARRLSNIQPDLDSFGLGFPQLYEELLVPPALFDWSSERARQRVLFARWKASMPLETRPLVGRTPLLEANLESLEPVAFSRLTLTAQLEVLGHANGRLWDACDALNPFLKPWRAAAQNGVLGLTTGVTKAREHLSIDRYAARFSAALRYTCAVACRTATAAHLQADFMRSRLAAGNLYPLLWSSET